MNYREILENQLCLDFSVDISQLKSKYNLFTYNKKLNGRRIYEWDDCILKICQYNNKFIMTSQSYELLDILKKEFENENAGFIGRFDNLTKLNSILSSFGHKICDCHHYYIPKNDVVIKNDVKTKWFEKEDLLIFKGNPEFSNALEFSQLRPDMLGICSYDKDEISAMAAASCDSSTMWQIGINVNDNYRNKGLGSYLVNMLKEEIIKRGILPFYGTVESHISSQNIALKCGFVPAFWQLYTNKI